MGNLVKAIWGGIYMASFWREIYSEPKNETKRKASGLKIKM